MIKITTSYSTGNFDHDKFWNIMRKWSKNNVVIISEFRAPKDFKCIWKKERKLTSIHIERKKVFEKLFIHRTLTCH